jgi:hypothetical protein
MRVKTEIGSAPNFTISTFLRDIRPIPYPKDPYAH